MRTHKVINKILCGMLALGMAFVSLPFTASALTYEDDIPINLWYFPDIVFCYYVQIFDDNCDGYLSLDERNQVTSLNLEGGLLIDLGGIEFFPALKTLDCSHNLLKDLNLERNTELTALYADDNLLSVLDLSQNPKLQVLYCPNNRLVELNIRSNNKLTQLNCSNNKLQTLDISGCPALSSLKCESNILSSLDLSKSPMLYSLHCSANLLSALDISKNPNLTALYCEKNSLKVLDVSNSLQLDTLYCGNNRLTSLDIRGNSKINDFRCYDNNCPVTVGLDRQLRLSDLPGGFDPSKASGFIGGKVKNGVLTVNKGEDIVTYNYDIGRLPPQEFRLSVTHKTPADFLSAVKKSVSVTVGKSTKLKVKNKTGKRLKWASSAPKTVSVKNGKITAKKIGTAKITAKANGCTATIKITVLPKAVKKFTAVNENGKITVTIKKADKNYQTYVEYRRSGSKASSYTLTNKNSYFVGLKDGKYTLRAYSYVKLKGKTYKSKMGKRVKIRIK